MRFPFKKPHTNMKHTLQVLTYNNYYNRIIKLEDDLEAYAEYVVFSIEGVNFNENDGIDTEHILGGATDYDGKGDYLLSIDENNNFKRWFILEAQRTRAGQWKLSLRRDLVADYKENAINAPAFIEKATVDSNDVAIFNSENMSFNQIKTSQTQILDNSKVAWLVAYLEKNTGVSGSLPLEKNNILEVDGIENWEFYKYSTEGNMLKLLLGNSTYEFSYILDDSFEPLFIRYATVPILSYDLNSNYVGETNARYVSALNRMYFLTGKDKLIDPSIVFTGLNVKDAISGINDFVTSLPNLNYSFVRDSLNGKLYSVRLEKVNEDFYDEYVVSSGSYSSLYYEMKRLAENWAKNQNQTNYRFPPNEGSTTDNHTFKLNLHFSNYRYILDEVDSSDEKTYDIVETHPVTTDSLYDVLCIPYGKINVYSGNTKILTSERDLSFKWITDIAKRGGAKVYDVQLLPFAPILYGCEIEDNSIYIDSSLYAEGTNFAILKDDNDNPISIGFYATSSIFSKNISFNLAIPQNEWKVENECSTWRLNSPNWASIFEFNVVKNGGQITEFSVDCHYKPYTPYINVAPTWGGLYGQSFEKEARGLILNGDFSIQRLDAAWTQYQLNNKTYEMAFNRQIQSVELKNRQQDVRDVVNAVAGTVQGGVSGAAGGAMVGGAYGAIAGAVVGTAASAVGGAIDVQMNRELRADQLDLTRDLYGYNLQAIKARPDTLTNVSAFNADNSIFPTLEYYTCTETEKQALRDKMKYNGMTVMRIGRIADFLLPEPQYIKARIIRLEGMDEDFHLVNELVNEIYKGVFI